MATCMTDPNVTKERGQKQGPSLKSLDFNLFEDTESDHQYLNVTNFQSNFVYPFTNSIIQKNQS